MIRNGADTDPAPTYALDARGTVELIGIPDVTLGGTLHVRYNTLGAVSKTISLGGAGEVAVVFTGNDTGTVTGTGLTLAVLGQQLSGDLTISHPATGGLRLVASNLEATLSAGGAPVVRLTNGAGTLTAGPQGITTAAPR